MEVEFTPEQQAQMATKAGTVPERPVTSVVTRYLDEEARFLASIEKGIAASLSKNTKWTRLEAMFKV